MSQGSTNSSTKLVLNLMNIAEEMLFSINLKPDIVRKYENMRESVFGKLGIPNDFHKYWDLQNKAKDLAGKKKVLNEREKSRILNSLDEANQNLSRTLVTFNYLTSHLKSSLEEAGNLNATEGKKISIDIANYSTELNKFESEVSGLINKAQNLEKELEKSQEKIRTFSLENQNLSKQISQVTEKHQEYLNKLESEYQSKIEQILSHNLNDSKKITDLEMSFHEKENLLIGQLDKLTTEDASVLKHLREKLEKSQGKNQDLRGVLKSISERTSIIFNEFVEKEEISEHLLQRKIEISEKKNCKVWQYYSEMLAEMDFIGYSLHKIKGDNDWLIEQLDAFCRENEELKKKFVDEPKQAKMQKVFSSLTGNDMVVKDFNEARIKLLSQFKETKKHE